MWQTDRVTIRDDTLDIDTAGGTLTMECRIRQRIVPALVIVGIYPPNQSRQPNIFIINEDRQRYCWENPLTKQPS